MAKGNSTFNVSLKLLTTQFNKGIKDIQRQIRGLGSFVKGAFAIGSITAFGRQVVQVASEFEDSMARVRAVSNASNHELKMMTEEARKLGASTKYTASEAANALENLTRNGMSATDATKSLSGVLKLAQANAIGLAQAADIVTNTLNIFGLSADEVTRVNDVLSATCANSATDITLLAEAIVGVGPVAKIMGKSIEETAAAIGTLANKGVKGSEAGRALGAMYSRLANQSPKAAAALAKYGLNVDEATLKNQTLSETLDMLAKSGVGEAMGDLAKIFGNNYYKVIASLINSQDEFNNMLEKTQNAAGTTQRMFEQGVGSTKEAIATLKSAYESFLESLGSKTSGVFNGVIKLLTRFINAMKNSGTAITTVISAVVIALNVKFAKALVNVKKEAAKTGVVLKGLSATMTTLKTVAQGAYAAMGGWVGILITIASIALPAIVNKVSQLNAVNRDLAKAESDAAGQAEKERAVLNKLHSIAADELRTREEREEAIRRIKEIQPGYNGMLNEEGKLINDNKEALDKYCDALEASIILKAKEAELERLVTERQDLIKKKLDAEQNGPSFWDKAAAAFSGMGGGGTATGGYYSTPVKSAEEIHAEKIAKYTAEIEDYTKKINDFKKNELEKSIEEVNKINSSLNNASGGSGGGGGGGGKTDLEKAKEALADAILDYSETISIIAKKQKDKLLTKEETEKELLNAEKTLIDAYYVASEKITDGNVLESDMFKRVLASYQKRLADSKAAEALEKANKQLLEDRNKRIDNASKNYYEARKDFKASEAKSKNQNPWDAFSSDSKGYKDEEIALRNLEDELNRVQKAYDELADDIQLLEAAGTEESKVILGWVKRLEAALPDLRDKVAAARNELYSKKANDEIIELDKDRINSYYGAIKSTTGAVSNLASAFEQLVKSDWSDMSFGEAFSTLSNAIFGTIDAIQSCIESFNSLFKIMDDLSLAKEKYAQISEATSAANVAAAEAEETANIATAGSEVLKGEAAELAKDKKVEEATATVSANTAEAVSGAAASQASIPYVGPILAAAAVAGVLALLAANLPKYASGGIIQGSSKYGDKLLARVNAGEAILNQRQQKRLLDIADGRSGGGNIVGTTIVHGKDLEIVFRNINKANARIAGSKGM